MPKDFQRTDRIAEQLKRELAQLIQYEVKDPRLVGWITVSDVTVTRDLQFAKVYVSFLATETSEDDIQQSMDILKQSVPFLRSQLAKRMQLRKMPDLTFIYDDSMQKGNHLVDVIEKAIAKDKPESDSDDLE
jgi:ribosome-binding factor A